MISHTKNHRMVEVDILEYFRLLAKYRKLLLFNVAVIVAVTVVLSLIWPKKYKSIASFVPSYTVQTPFSQLRKADTPDLAFFLEQSETFISDIYAGIMQARAVKVDVIEKTGLRNVFRHKVMDDVIKDLERNSSIEVNEERVITLTVYMPDPNLAAYVANTWVETLDSLNQAKIKNKGHQDAVFISDRLSIIGEKLNLISDSLAGFESKYRIYALEEEINATVSVYADIATQLLQKEIELMRWKNASHNMPVRRSLEQEIANLRKKLKEMEENWRSGIIANVSFRELPRLQLEHARLQRERVVLDSLYSYVLLESEIANLQATVNIPTLVVIDEAVPPEKRAWPTRSKIVLFSAFVAIIFNMLLVLALEHVKLRWNF